MGDLAFCHRLDAEEMLQDPVRRRVEEPDRRPEDKIEQAQRRTNDDGRGQSLPDRENFSPSTI